MAYTRVGGLGTGHSSSIICLSRLDVNVAYSASFPFAFWLTRRFAFHGSQAPGLGHPLGSPIRTGAGFRLP